MNVHPGYLEPHLIGYRPGKLPDVFTVVCTGPLDHTPIEMMGRTPMARQHCTVYRYVCEADEALQARVDAVVKAFKAKYGWNQRVSVIYQYEASAELGQYWQTWDDLVNLKAWAFFAKRNLKKAAHKRIADRALLEIDALMVQQRDRCVPPGLH